MNSALIGVDIGAPRRKGSTRQSGSRVEIAAGGADIWETRDEFHFAYVPVGGDFTLSARIESLAIADLYTKAGLMLRSSLDDGAEHAFLLAFGDNRPRNNNNGGVEFQFRSSPNGSCTGIYPPQPLPPEPDFPASFPNLWLRLSRSGPAIAGEYSNDGKHWKTFARHRQSFGPSACAGLAVTSHNADQAVRCVFSEVRLEQS